MTEIDKAQNANNNDNNTASGIMKKMTNATHTVSDLGNSISNHFVLVSGDAANALLDETQFTNE